MAAVLLIEWGRPELWVAVAAIVGLPTAWNIVARYEYRTHALTRFFGPAAQRLVPSRAAAA
jgi:hypothetical protein